MTAKNPSYLVQSNLISWEQKKHFWLFDIFPLILGLFVMAFLFWTGVYFQDLFVFIFMWVLSCLGIEVGFHRYFSHRSFKANQWVETFLFITGCFSAQGPPMAWSSNHVHHHAHADQAGDTHSPHHPKHKSKWANFWHAHLLWKYQYPFANPYRYAKWMMSCSYYKNLSRYYYAWIFLGLILPMAIQGLWMGTWEGACRGLLLISSLDNRH